MSVGVPAAHSGPRTWWARRRASGRNGGQAEQTASSENEEQERKKERKKRLGAVPRESAGGEQPLHGDSDATERRKQEKFKANISFGRLASCTQFAAKHGLEHRHELSHATTSCTVILAVPMILVQPRAGPFRRGFLRPQTPTEFMFA